MRKAEAEISNRRGISLLTTDRARLRAPIGGGPQPFQFKPEQTALPQLTLLAEQGFVAV